MGQKHHASSGWIQEGLPGRDCANRLDGEASDILEGDRALRGGLSCGSSAPRSSDVRREKIVDEGLVAKPTPLRLAPDSVENLGIDPNRDQSPGRRP
jgi:hypothetical protein